MIEIVRDVPLPPIQAWRRLTDWERHAEFVTLTTTRTTADGFVARTGFGRFAIDDPMQIVAWNEPTHCRLEKRGRVVTGWAELIVEARGQGSRVIWREEIHVRGVPRFADGITRILSRRLFGHVLDGLLEK